MPRIPRVHGFDSTIALRRDPYRFVANTCRELGSDLFEARLLLRPTVCMTGAEAAELFYDESRFIRKGATPGRIQKTLFGEGGVQGLDDAAHVHRKRMFMDLMIPERVAELERLAHDVWAASAIRWAAAGRVVLYDEVRQLLTAAVCAWAGVPLPAEDVRRRTRELTAMFDQAGSLGPPHWWARLARASAEGWAAEAVDAVRAGRLEPPENSAAATIARYRDPAGAPLPRNVAAVELLNVLRPTVAVAVFIVFCAHALHAHPECARRIRSGDAAYLESFVQEVRRYYPFFPSVLARTRKAFEWRGYPFPEGREVMLDLHGTNRDPRAWDGPEEFRAERFLEWGGDLYTFIPQGGGDPHRTHRCPGEPVAIALMKVASRFLASGISYDVPAQDLAIDWGRLPALPRSGFVLERVRAGP